jgi:hypothetical protein
MRKYSIPALASFCWLLALAAPSHASSIFINGSDEPYNPSSPIYTPFTDTVNGITASFTGSTDPLAFQIAPTAGYVTWGPEMILTNNVGSTLTIDFSQNLDTISMDFGTYTSDALTLTLYSGANVVGRPIDVSGTQLVSNGFYEGIIGLSGQSFNAVVLSDASSAIPIFGVGNITVANAPEPGYFWMFPALGFGLAIWKRRSGFSLSA